MAAEAERILELAAAVADGRLVDWGAAESSANTPQERELVRQLRLLAGVGEVHRSETLDGTTAEEVVDEAISAWGPFELHERLGGGSFGTVYRARDPRLARDVALKLLRGATQNGSASTIVEEGRLLARVRHPHVITVYGADCHAGRVGIWMELIRGRTLEDVVRQDGPFSAREAASIGEELCGALAAVHAQGLVHRDVKAQNVMREEGGRVVLMDFGAGQERASVDGRPIGTPAYMAPELLDGGTATISSDLYSLGVLLFRLVTGEYPVHGRSADQIRGAHEVGARRLLRDLRPDLPAAFVAVVERALSADPDARFASAGAMEAALRHAIRRDADPAVGRRRPIGRRAAMAAAAVALLAIAVSAFWWRDRLRAVLWPQPVRTVAVLPLRNLTGDAGQDYFVSGVTDLLLTRMAAIDSLRVIAPSSTARLVDEPGRLARVASDLRADYLFEGSVARAGDRVRISVRLLAAGSGAVEWGQTYERGAVDLFAVQGEIASAIAAALRARIEPGEIPPAAGLYTTSAEAQEAYLRGRYLLYRFDRAAMPEMRRAFETAVTLDPQFALAHASLARAYLMLHAYDLVPPEEVQPLALAAARRAVELAPALPEARVALAEARFKCERNWDGADAEYREAVRLAPNASVVRSPYARFLSGYGKPKEALTHARAGLAGDPVSPEMLATLGITHYYLREFDQAVEAFERAIALNPRYSPGIFGRARARSAQGQFEAAIRDLGEAIPLSGNDASYVAELARVHAAAGWRNAAEQILGGLIEETRAAGRRAAPQDLAYVYTALGDRDRALALLAEALRENYTRVLFLRVDPRVDSLRDDARFQDLLKELGGAR